jgi:hypothetical protein
MKQKSIFNEATLGEVHVTLAVKSSGKSAQEPAFLQRIGL